MASLTAYLSETASTNFQSATDWYRYDVVDADACSEDLCDILSGVWYLDPDTEIEDALVAEGLDPEEVDEWARRLGTAGPGPSPDQQSDAQKKRRAIIGEILAAEIGRDFHGATRTLAPNLDHPTSFLKSQPGIDVLAFARQDDSNERCSGCARLLIVSVKTSKNRMSKGLIEQAEDDLCGPDFKLKALRQLRYLRDVVEPADRQAMTRLVARALRPGGHPAVIRAPATVTEPSSDQRYRTALKWLGERAQSRAPIARVITVELAAFEGFADAVFSDLVEGGSG